MGTQKKIVVVEDQEEIREAEMDLLQSEGYEVVGVGDGLLALPTIKRERADLVLLDLILPGKEGNEILEELAADTETRLIPVFIMSAYVDRLRRTPQVRRILPKPFDLDEFINAVRAELS
ncbi:response regulator [Vitiosangium sp. GDMCC 1.1324]|uniref:response regulator n=1 Tax=Vitiosangium sp. (strain GDMCC 1.1324) TaxID=2138576 RepID=UPI00130D7B93|nr:response regulator [Vitiosangium sp. GDMCC 1.1324]